jgi:hypothetical protein
VPRDFVIDLNGVSFEQRGSACIVSMLARRPYRTSTGWATMKTMGRSRKQQERVKLLARRPRCAMINMVISTGLDIFDDQAAALTPSRCSSR